MWRSNSCPLLLLLAEGRNDSESRLKFGPYSRHRRPDWPSERVSNHRLVPYGQIVLVSQSFPLNTPSTYQPPAVDLLTALSYPQSSAVRSTARFQGHELLESLPNPLDKTTLCGWVEDRPLEEFSEAHPDLGSSEHLVRCILSSALDAPNRKVQRLTY